uniref:Peptidase A1 domain-containing protein n=1 Tax=Angiostrongylus cantonensis TaxID=6313 RepID=A0A158P8I1_ANGCA
MNHVGATDAVVQFLNPVSLKRVNIFNLLGGQNVVVQFSSRVKRNYPLKKDFLRAQGFKKHLVPFFNYNDDLYLGNVTIGTLGATVKNQKYVHVTQAGNAFSYMSIDDILGLGRSTITTGGIPTGSLAMDWILDEAWTRTYCSMYDFGQNRIGFAKAIHSES